MKKVSEASCFQMVERDLMATTTGEKRSIRYMRGGKTLVHNFWQTHWFRGEIPAKFCRVEKKMTGKFLNGSIIILAELLSRR